jgi:inner membrane protein
MPSLFSHPAVPFAIVSAVGTRSVSIRLFLAGVIFAILPDADVIGFRFGIPYDHLLGHRGFFHSPIFAGIASLISALAYRPLRSTYWTAFAVLFLSMLMHGILDAATNGGLGIAFLSPFSNQRYFFPWQPIAVSPFGLKSFLSSRGFMIIQSELKWVWVPFLSIGFIGFLIRHTKLSNKSLKRTPQSGAA